MGLNPELRRIITTPVMDVYEELRKAYSRPIPQGFDTVDDLRSAMELMARAKNEYAYLNSMHAGLEVLTKIEKDSEMKQELMMRRDLYDRFAREVKFRYEALSRMLSAKQSMNRELDMTRGGEAR